MCGRFAMSKELDELVVEFVTTTGKRPQEYRPGWNLSPTDDVLVVREREGQRELEMVRWDMVPPSSPSFDARGRRPIFNARIETITSKGMFKHAFQHRRCIVPATGYYEWLLEGGAKQPYFVTEPGQTLAMAGIIGVWQDRSKPEDDPARWRESMAIITRDAHKVAGEVHDRMPALLTPDIYDDWLGSDLGSDELLELLGHSSIEVAEELDAYPVSRAVNNGGKNKVDSPELIEPL